MDGNRVPLERQALMDLLRDRVMYWRALMKSPGVTPQGVMTSRTYIDAYQDVYHSLFGVNIPEAGVDEPAHPAP